MTIKVLVNIAMNIFDTVALMLLFSNIKQTIAESRNNILKNNIVFL